MRREWLPGLVVFAAYVVVAVAATWPLALNLGTHLTGDPGGDTGVYIWNQWVFQHEALEARRMPLTTERILSLSGSRADLSQHNYTLFLNLLSLPLIPLFGVVASFNLVMLAATVLTGLCTYALARRAFEVPRLEAWLAGVAFAWSPVLVARTTGHFSLVAAAPLAAFIYCLIAADRSRQPRDAALAGLCMAWAGFCDAYYAVFCLLITGIYVVASVVAITGAEERPAAAARWLLNILIIAVGGLVLGLAFGGGGRMELLGVPISVRGLYTPVFVLTMLIVARLVLHLRARLTRLWPPPPSLLRAAVIGIIASAGPLSPVLYGLGQRIADGRFVSPPVLWRSSPRGVDLLALFEPNPNHPLVRWLYRDAQNANPTSFVEYTAALSLVAIAVVALGVWSGGFRPKRQWWWMTAGFAALSLGPFVHVMGLNTHVPGPWSLVRYVPLAGMARTPTRFAIVAALGVAVLMAGALAALGRRYPSRRPIMVGVVAAALFFELLPAPRTLYAAHIPAVYDVIAHDPREIRVLELPFGVRDGVSSVGNFSARYQFYQTRHGKRLIGGYLSRVSKRRIERMRSGFITLDYLFTLSEGGVLTPEQQANLSNRAARFLRRGRVGYVVVHEDVAPPLLVRTAIEAFGLEEVARDGATVLYRPVLPQPTEPAAGRVIH